MFKIFIFLLGMLSTGVGMSTGLWLPLETALPLSILMGLSGGVLMGMGTSSLL